MNSSNFASFLVSLLALRYLSSFLFYFSLSSYSFVCSPYFFVLYCVLFLSSPFSLVLLIPLFFPSVVFLYSSFSFVCSPYFIVLPLYFISIFPFSFVFSPSFILPFCFISPNPLHLSFVMLLLSLLYSSPSCPLFLPFILFIPCSLEADTITNYSVGMTVCFSNNISSTALPNVLEATKHENLFHK